MSAATASQQAPLRRSTDDVWLGGVAAGLARRLGVAPAWTRLAFVVATVAMNLFQPLWTTPSLPGSTSMLGRLAGGSVDPWLVIGVVVVLGTVVPFFLEIVALRHLPATVVGVVAMLEPVIATVLGWAWFRESLTPVQAAGAVAVLAGIVLAQTSRRSQMTVPAP